MNENSDIIAYRREKATQALNDAELLYSNNSLTSSINRMYYSMFYEVSALLLMDDLSSSKHSGILSLFQKHFIKTNIINKNSGKFFSKIFEYRQMGDYSDFVEFDKSEVLNWLNMTKSFISELEDVISKKLNI